MEMYTLLKIKELFQLKVKIDPNTKKAMCDRTHPCSIGRVAWSSRRYYLKAGLIIQVVNSQGSGQGLVSKWM